MSQSTLTYNTKYFDGTNLKQMKASIKGMSKEAFKTYKTKDGTLVGLFQGSRGARPDIDFVDLLLRIS